MLEFYPIADPSGKHLLTRIYEPGAPQYTDGMPVYSWTADDVAWIRPHGKVRILKMRSGAMFAVPIKTAMHICRLADREFGRKIYRII